MTGFSPFDRARRGDVYVWLYDIICTSEIASEKLVCFGECAMWIVYYSLVCMPPMDFLLRRNRRQLYIIDGCMRNGMV